MLIYVQTPSFGVLSSVLSHLQVTSRFDSVYFVVARWVNLRPKNVTINMNPNYPTTMNNSIVAQMFVFLVKKISYLLSE